MRVRVLNIRGALVVGRSLKACWHVTKVELKALRAPPKTIGQEGLQGAVWWGGRNGDLLAE